MIEDIKSIIEKNLPAQVGDTLKARLAEADKAEATVKSQTATIAAQQNTINELSAQVRTYRQHDERNAALDVRQSKIEDSERTLRIRELEFQLKASDDKTQFARELAMGLVRNVEYRSSAFSNKSVPIKDHHGYQTFVNENSDENKTTSASLNPSYSSSPTP